MGRIWSGRRLGMALGAVAVLASGGLTLSAVAQSSDQASSKPAAPAATPSAASPRPAGYLTAAELPDSLVIVGPPPEPGSLRDKADRDAFDASRALEASPRWKQAQQDVELFGDKAHGGLSCATGKTISLAATPTLSRLLDRVVIDAGSSTNAAKQKYSRVRPPIGNDQPICVAREDWMRTNGSYPSGHAAAGWAWGLVLAEIAPDQASAILTRARDFGDSRWICGVHFQSDVEAGRTMGAASVARLHANPAFVADLAAARAELEKAPTAEGCAAL
jgi:acid phosphatase (class A)